MKEITSDYYDQLKKNRTPNFVSSLYTPLAKSFHQKDWHLWLAEDDQGVVLNRGRVGSKNGPRVLLHHFGMMQKPKGFNHHIYYSNFPKTQFPLDLWPPKYHLPQHLQTLHLGSGHDHVYHFLKLALENKKKNFFIINLDAHADMRKDPILHSGTPFRYFFEKHKKNISNYHVEQWGLSREYQNDADLELKGATLNCFWQDEVTEEKIFNRINKIKKILSAQKKDLFLLLSLDADVVSGSNMPAVSAVNPLGLCPHSVKNILQQLKKELKTFNPVLGIYEYNPLYDTVSAMGAKYLASLMHQWIF